MSLVQLVSRLTLTGLSGREAAMPLIGTKAPFLAETHLTAASSSPYRDIHRRQSRRIHVGRVPVGGAADLVVVGIGPRGRESIHLVDLRAEADQRADVADRLTLEQATILRVTRLLHRVEVRGGAGSGKTVLALQQAKELTRGLQDRKPQRVALLCYSIGLAEHLRREVARWDRRHRPAFVGTFHAFGKQWGAPDGDRTDSDFWEERLPAEMAELASALPDGHKYDAVIVDEAQDFADSWWTPVLRALRDEEEGGLYVYSDENQRIFARFGRPPVALVPLVLDHNLRNTRQIHESFGPLAPSRMYSRGGDGPAVRFLDTAGEDLLDPGEGGDCGHPGGGFLPTVGQPLAPRFGDGITDRFRRG